LYDTTITGSTEPRGADLEREGAARATFAAGCFWGVEASFREIEGVLDTAVGYTGGIPSDPSYEQVCSGRTGHAEAVDVRFDPNRVSYPELLRAFWSMHNPTTKDQQGWDFGSQYRSAIFFHDAEQERQAIASRDERQAGLTRPIVTAIVPAPAFYDAEDYHQRFFEQNGGAVCATTIR
jgi:peptide-methionine (S)-S-oxide reductase